MRKNIVICDVCETSEEDFKGSFPEGWVNVKKAEISGKDFEEIDFCSKQCFCRFFKHELEGNERNKFYLEKEKQKTYEEEEARVNAQKQEYIRNRSDRLDLSPEEIREVSGGFEKSDERIEEVSNPDDKKKKRFGFFG